MTIAIHISSRDDIHGFVLDSFLTAAKDHPNDHFIFIFDKPPAKSIALPANTTPVNAGPEIKNNLLRYYWYNYKIPSLLNRYQAEVLFTPREVCSLNTDIPQVMLLSEITKTRGGRRDQLRKKYSHKAFRIGVFEKAVYSKAAKFYPKTKLFFSGHGLLNEKAEKAQEEEQPYFASVITKHNRQDVITLLKAFSLFKKWQRSSYKLFLLINDKEITEPVPNFSTYKYKDDVLIIKNSSPEEISNLLARSFAIIQLFNSADGSRVELEAMRSSVPVISTCGEKERADYFDSASLYTKNTDAGIAEQMMRLYKDENTYREFSERAYRFAIEFTWHSTSETLYHIAEEAVAQRL